MEQQRGKQWLGKSLAGLKSLQSLTKKKSLDSAVSQPFVDHFPQPIRSRQPSIDKKVLEEEKKKALEKRESLKEEAISSLPEGFFDEDFDPGLFELQQLQPGFQLSELDETAEARANVLEYVSERLSKHVLANYDMFLKGINEAASVETDLEAALTSVRSTRHVLARTHTEVNSHLAISNKQKHRLALASMAETLLNLQQASSLQQQLRSAEEVADFTACFWLCAQCCEALEKLEKLTAAEELQKEVNKLYQDSERHLNSALANVCTDFEESRYCTIVEAYTFLGNMLVLGEDVNSSFVNVINTSTMKVVRGVVLTRSGLVERAQSTTVLQEILKWLPPDLYRQCLSKVLMVVFDILASHYRMTAWHESAIQSHLTKVSDLKAQIDFLQLDSQARPATLALASSPELVDHEAAAASPSSKRDQSQTTGSSQQGGPNSQHDEAASVEIKEPLRKLGGQAANDEQSSEAEAGTSADKDLRPGSSGLAAQNQQEPQTERAIGDPSGKEVSPDYSAQSGDGNAMDGDQLEEDAVEISNSEDESLQSNTLEDGVQMKQEELRGDPVETCSEGLNGAADQDASYQQRPGVSEVGHIPGSSRESDTAYREPPHRGESKANGNAKAQAKLRDDTVSSLPDHSARLRPSLDEAEQNQLQEPEALTGLREEHERETVWGETLMRVSEALSTGKRWVWDEAGRKVSLLLSSPAAFQGEHFLQVLEWSQTIVNIGEAFSGAESSHLRDAMHRHSGKFFQAYHVGNLQALQQMLDRELWEALPALPGRAPDFKAELEGRTKDQPEQSPTTFQEWLDLQNPWKRSTNESARASVEDLTSQSDVPSEALSVTIGTEATTANGLSHDPESNGVSSPRAKHLMTNASWKMMQWMSEYAGLMRLLPSEAGKIYCGCCELFELYFLHTFYCYSEVPIMDLLKQGSPAQMAVEELPVRLRTAIIRVVTRSLPKLRDRYIALSANQAGQQKNASGPGGHIQNTLQSLKSQNTLQSLKSDFGSQGAQATSSESQLGLQERKVAVDSLNAAAQQLQEALPIIARLLAKCPQVPDHHSLDNFKQTLNAAHDLRDVILSAGARLKLPISWIPDRLAEQNFNLEEPPTRASPWVGVLYKHAVQFWQELADIKSMTTDDRHQLWQYGIRYMAELVLEGFARAGVRSKCTMMGRAAMSVDLQGLQRGLQSITPSREIQAMITDGFRVVDVYVKAFYLPWGDELQKWAMTHPEYTQGQIIMLVNCIAEFQSIKRRERNQLVSLIEADLKELR